MPDIESVRIVYTEEPDDMAETHDQPNTLYVEAVDACAGHYLVISTERWAIDAESD